MRKRGIDGKVKTFKTWLVVKGYTQKEGFNYEETFSPIAMIKYIRILLSIAAHMDYEIWQMDVKTAFLNGSLNETFIWFSQRDSLLKVKKRKCASYKSSFMDLSMHLGLETSNLINRSSHLDLSNILMSLVCTRGAVETWWYFSYFM